MVFVGVILQNFPIGHVNVQVSVYANIALPLIRVWLTEESAVTEQTEVTPF